MPAKRKASNAAKAVTKRSKTSSSRGYRSVRDAAKTIVKEGVKALPYMAPAVYGYFKGKYRKRNYGAPYSKSAGFVKTKLKKRYRRKEIKVEKGGVSELIERGGIVDGGAQTSTAGNTVVVGHCTMPKRTVLKCMFRAIVKQLFIRVGTTNISNFNDVIPGATAGSLIRLRYYTTAEASLSNLDYNVTTTTTYEDCASNLLIAFETASAEISQIELQDISFQPGAADRLLAYVIMDLRTARLHFYSKSTLKFQNRTVNDAADDEQSVDNVPLYGKMYYGIGNGTGAVNRNSIYTTASRDFIADDTNGVMSKVPTERWYQEPVGPEMLEKVSKFGKIHLDPGQIKTSSLTTKKSIGVNQLIKAVAVNNILPVVNHTRHYLGHYRFMMVEKMITAVAGTSINSIKLAFEHNLKIGCYMTVWRNTLTAPITSISTVYNSEN